MDSIILLSVLAFSDGLNLLKEFDVSVAFLLLVLECFNPDLLGILKLTRGLESTVSERMSTISVLRKLDMFIKGSTVNQNLFPFLYRHY